VQQWINIGAFRLAPAGTFGKRRPQQPDCAFLQKPGRRRKPPVPVWATVALQFRAEASTPQSPEPGCPGSDLDTPSFGSIQQAEAARQLQFGLKIRF